MEQPHSFFLLGFFGRGGVGVCEAVTMETAEMRGGNQWRVLLIDKLFTVTSMYIIF